eukprot:TRINITY_DN2887_c0_g1_i29.p1 TRINITY_DN2887_c0_g1~~TRINITY_DN2887_c0_g1_i29.p1  ORF type:complete len:145 (-),score=17.59 TRINITY_DN2887_c0_g1_i29:30-464(-)
MSLLLFSKHFQMILDQNSDVRQSGDVRSRAVSGLVEVVKAGVHLPHADVARQEYTSLKLMSLLLFSKHFWIKIAMYDNPDDSGDVRSRAVSGLVEVVKTGVNLPYADVAAAILKALSDDSGDVRSRAVSGLVEVVKAGVHLPHC